LALQNTYLKHEYVCQYDESHFNFVSRWAQREGIYYFFEQTANGEKVIFTDTKISHKDLLLGKDLFYVPPSGLDSAHTKEVVKSFLCRHNMLPSRVYLKDYNYLKPSLAIEGIADVDENGRGENYIYGEHFDTPEEGNRLARIRAEALLCRKSVFSAESSVPFIVPGYTFDLNDHYKDVYIRKYLVTDVTHEGHQTGYLISGISTVLEQRDEQMFYSNTFTAIYSDEQFRPEHINQKPKISGTINAKIDAASSGQYAELDEHGRYKVILPFDRSGRFNGKASAWFRMVQPYAGQNQGMHFPLHKGTEVLLTFIDGNPDRPLIAGAVPNPETSSPVNVENQTRSVITTGKNPVNHSVGAADNLGLDSSGSFASGQSVQTDNYIEFEDLSGAERIRIHSDKDIWQEAQERFAEYTIGVPTTSEGRPTEISDLIGKMYDFSSSGFAPTGVKLYADDSPYGTLLTSGSGTTFPPVGTSGNAITDNRPRWQYLVDRGEVKIAKGDTFITQEGNIYDFGGYWNYNLGNCYIENHIDQTAKLNSHDYSFDLLDKGGPDWTGWRTIQSEHEGGSTNEIKETWNKGNWSPGNIWVEKKFGDSYEYVEGNTLSVIKGHSQEIIIGGKTIEEKYSSNKENNGIVKRRYFRSASETTTEKKWTNTGFLLSDMTSTTTGENNEIKNTTEYHYGARTNFTWDFASSVDFTGKMSAAQSMSLNVGGRSVQTFDLAASFSLALSAAAKTAISVSVAAQLDISASAAAKIDISADASLFLKISAGAGVGMEIEAKPATLTYKSTNGKFKWHGPGTKLEKEAALKLEMEKFALRKMMSEMKTGNLQLVKLSLAAAKHTANLQNSNITLFT